MTILSIYERYSIPPNLARHQFEVAAVGDYICDRWQGVQVDRELISLALMLHDMGNIIKFKRPFLGELEKDAHHWEKIQDEFITKYGTDVHQATLAIVDELGLIQVSSLINDMKNVWSEPQSNHSWEARICEYADCTVTPKGITGFNQRLEDLKQRYGLTEASSPMIEARKNGALVEKHVSVDLTQIDRIDFSKKIGHLKKYEVSGEGFDPSTATL